MPIHRIVAFNYRSFPPSNTPIPLEGSFSPHVNIIVGANGSGKTTFMNALKLSFSRDAENSQAHLTSARVRRGAPSTERNQPESPWYIQVDCAFPDSGNNINCTWKIHETTPGAPLRREVVHESPGRDQSKTLEHWLRDRGFPMGWPRRLGHLYQGAFVTLTGDNQDFYEKAWPLVRQDVLRHLKYDIPHPKDWITEKGWQCPTCMKPNEKGLLGRNLIDHNGRPLFEGSDGLAHFFYMILEIRKHTWETSFFIEEPDVYLHPTLQREFLRYVLHLSKEHRHQFFITTHSPYLLNFANRDEADLIRIFQFGYRDGHTEVSDIALDDRRWELLSALGHRPADVMQPSGIIWVEGPSDKIYLQAWLDAYAREQNHPEIRWGLDCDIVWYGGHNITYVNMKHFYDPDATGKPALLSLLGLNPNAAFVLDADINCDGSKQFFSVKQRVQEECLATNRYCWLVEPRCIEDAVHPDCVTALRPKGGEWPPPEDKPKFAETFSDYARTRPLGAILKQGVGYADKVAGLYSQIRKWSRVEA